MDTSKLPAQPTYDVVVIGSGVAGALLAHRLANTRKVRVLILEAGGMPSDWNGRRLLINNFAASSSKGQDSPYVEEVSTGYYASPPSANAPQPLDEGSPPYYLNIDGTPNRSFRSFYERVVGGSLWHWQGIVLRMLPNDFKLNSAYHVKGARDWPIGYGDLAEHYRRAEYEMGVSASIAAEKAMDKYFGVPENEGKRGYPRELRHGIPQSYLDKYIRSKLKGEQYVEHLPNGETHTIPLRVTPLSQARNAKPFDGRPACDGQASCIPLCPSRAKYEALFHVEKAISAGAELRTNAVVTKLNFGDSGNVVDVLYRDSPDMNKPPKRVRGRYVVLAANAIENPRLLLFSESPNPNKWVGKFLMDHPGVGTYALVPDPVYSFRGPQTTSHIETLRDGPFRQWRAAFKISLRNDGWGAVGAPRGRDHMPPDLTYGSQTDRAGTVLDLVHNFQIIGGALREKIRIHAHRQISLGTALEQLPWEGNRVDISTNGRDVDLYNMPLPVLTYTYDDPTAYTTKGLMAVRKVHEQIVRRLGATAYRFGVDEQGRLLPANSYTGSGHIMGTTIMGGKGEPRVVDSSCQSVDHPNLYIVGSSVFTTGAVANPTLTIAALSLRAADTIYGKLNAG